MIGNKYNITQHIGTGSFGTIYKGKNIRTHELVAIKVEKKSADIPLLKRETKIYQYLKGLSGIPEIKWFGGDSINSYMVMTLLYESLKSRRERMGSFSLGEAIDLKNQMVSICESIHKMDLIHRDIKPDNFMFGSNDKLYIIDFGLCKKRPKELIKRETNTIIGTPNYISINVHQFMEPTEKDDLESVGYVMLYLYLDRLPWSNPKLINIEIQHMKERFIHGQNQNVPTKLLDYFYTL